MYKVKQGKTSLDSYSLSFIRDTKPVTLFETLRRYGFIVKEKYPGIYYISGKNLIPIQIIVSRRLNRDTHLWLNSLSKKLSAGQAEKLLAKTDSLGDLRDKEYADTIWEIVASANVELIDKMKEDNNMCKALMEIFKPEFDAAVNAAVSEVKENAFNDGFNNGIDNKGIKIFINMIRRGFSREDAQAMAEISDELVKKALEMC